MIPVSFREPLPLAFKEELERRIFYISDEIEAFHLNLCDDLITGVEVCISEGARPRSRELAAKICVAVENERKKGPTPPAERIWCNSLERAYCEDAFAQLSRRGEAFEMGTGLIGVGELFIGLFGYLDSIITSMVKAKFSAMEYRYPTLIQTDVMRRGEYLKYFPHLIMFTTRLHSDYETYQAVMREEAEGPQSSYLRHCGGLEFCLPPTVCYHTYRQLSDRKVNCKPGLVITSQGKSFRFESKYQRHLERLWDFTIREVVFIGTNDFVRQSRQRFMEEIFRLMKEWELVGYCESANDPFFAESGDNNKQLAQRLMRLKYELRVNLAPARTLAAASFNLHNDFIGRSFNIRLDDGTVAQTACAGVGLERLAFAFLCQHGLEPDGWPKSVREQLPSARRSDLPGHFLASHQERSP